MNNLYCLNNSRKRLREKKKRKRRGGERKRSVERGVDDSSGHEVSLVTAVIEKATDNCDYRRFWVNSTSHHSRYGSYYPRKSEFATGLDFKRNSGCLKKYGGGSSLPRIYGITTVSNTNTASCKKNKYHISNGQAHQALRWGRTDYGQ